MAHFFRFFTNIDKFLHIIFSADAVVYPWLDSLWEKLMAIYPLPPGLEIIPASIRYIVINLFGND